MHTLTSLLYILQRISVKHPSTKYPAHQAPNAQLVDCYRHKRKPVEFFDGFKWFPQ